MAAPKTGFALVKKFKPQQQTQKAEVGARWNCVKATRILNKI